MSSGTPAPIDPQQQTQVVTPAQDTPRGRRYTAQGRGPGLFTKEHLPPTRRPRRREIDYDSDTMDTHPDDDINLEDYIAPDFDLTPQETTPPPSHSHRYEGATLGALTKIKTFDDRIPRGVGAAYLIATKAQVIGMSGLTDAQWTAKFGTATEIPAPTEVPEPELPATPSADERATYTVEMKAFQAARPRTERYHTIKEGIKRHIAKVYPQEAKRLMNEYGIFPPHLTIRELWANVKSTVVTEHKIEEEATEIMYEIQNLKMTHEDGGAGYSNTMNDKRAALQYINCTS